MKRETVIGMILLGLFVVMSFLGGEAFQLLMYLVGCWFVGFTVIPNASQAIDKFLTARKVV